MTTPRITLTVLPHDAHGIPAIEYADTLRWRLPDHTVRLAETPEEQLRLVAKSTVVTGKQLDEELIEAAPDLRLFACITGGVDHLPFDSFEANDVAVTNASGVHGPNIAAHVFGWILMSGGWTKATDGSDGESGDAFSRSPNSREVLSPSSAWGRSERRSFVG
ncbi:Rossmann-fold NAD(P)-binding domain-containing protein [Halogranum amylolyticum]